MIGTRRFIIVYAMIVLAGLYMHLHADMIIPMKKLVHEFPAQHGHWEMTSETIFSANVLRVLKPTYYIDRQYRGPQNRSVHLYIGYHNGGKDSGGIHSPKLCLPGSGWFEMTEQRTSLDLQGKKLNLVKAIYEKGGAKGLFLYWYCIKGKTLSDEYSLKIEQVINSLFHNRRDAALVRVFVPIEIDEDTAYLTGEQFIRDFYPIIEEFLPA